MEEQPQANDGTGGGHLFRVAVVVGMGLLLASLYTPLVLWLGRTTLQAGQLHNGGLIVVFALVIGLRRLVRTRPLVADFSWLGMVLLLVGLGMLYLLEALPKWTLPLALVSFCLSFAGMAAFLYGRDGVKALGPAIIGVLLLGMLAGLAPGLDWPMRQMAAEYSAALLDRLGMPVGVAVYRGQPPQLLLGVRGEVFVVAAECNGFGLLSSSVLVAAVLGFYYDLTWPQRAGLLLVSVPLAIAFNALRIVGITLAATHLTLPYVVIHEGVGLVMYCAALLILWWLARRRSMGQRRTTEGPAPETVPPQG